MVVRQRPEAAEVIFRFAPHHLVQDYLDTGWHLANVDLDHHGEYSVLLQWLCDCPLPASRRPNPSEEPDERHPILTLYTLASAYADLACRRAGVRATGKEAAQARQGAGQEPEGG